MIEDLTDKKFGRFTAKEVIRRYLNRHYWLCECLCGNQIEIRSDLLKSGRTKRKCKYTCPFGFQKSAVGESGFLSLLYKYKREAKKRGHFWGLSKEKFRSLTRLDCFFCGGRPGQVSSHSKGTKCSQEATTWAEYIYNGIDRLNNDVGYIEENCIPCCGNCNHAKRKMNTIDFLSHIEKIYNHSIINNVQKTS